MYRCKVIVQQTRLFMADSMEPPFFDGLIESNELICECRRFMQQVAQCFSCTIGNQSRGCKKVIKTQPCMEKINYTTLWTTNQIHFWYLVFFTSNLELLDNILCLELRRILDKFRLRWKGTTIEMLVLETWVQIWNYLNKKKRNTKVALYLQSYAQKMRTSYDTFCW
jgi:hypothetical protein